MTNFHVVSQAALKPEQHDLVYVTADGREAPVTILQIDVLHDLALLKASDAGSRSFDALTFRPATQALAQGERIYSLGNPLDVGFAVMEGNYNGLVRRSFYPQIFFGGALSGGMSGGPIRASWQPTAADPSTWRSRRAASAGWRWPTSSIA